MKRYLAAFALIGLLTVSALAGDISTSGAPAQTSNGTTVSPTSPGDIPSGGRAELADDALSALLSVLSFLV